MLMPALVRQERASDQRDSLGSSLQRRLDAAGWLTPRRGLLWGRMQTPVLLLDGELQPSVKESLSGLTPECTLVHHDING